MIEYEKYCDECTFNPDLTASKRKKNSSNFMYLKIKINIDNCRYLSGGLYQAISRIKKGNEHRKNMKQW